MTATTRSAKLELMLLGTTGLSARDGREVRTVLAQPKRLALLAYLAVARPRSFHRRDTLLALFWPDHDQVHARRALNRAVHFLRSALGDAAIASRGDEELGLSPGQWECDVHRFEEAAAGDPSTAIALYRGHLLTGFFVRDAAGFEEWLEFERARLRQAAIECAWAQAAEFERRGLAAEASRFGQKALELSGDDEEVVRRLLRLLARLGTRSDAIRIYDAFADRFRRDNQLDPSPDLQALIGAIRADRSAGLLHDDRGFTAPEDATGQPVDLRRTTEPVPSNEKRKVAVAGGARRQHQSATTHSWNNWRFAAIVVFGILSVGYMTLRAFADTTPRSLVTTGAISQNERLLVADFDGPVSDTALGPVISEAFRASLGQSRTIAVVQQSAVRDVLTRMRRPATSRVDLVLAQEIATREGIKAILHGEVMALGGNYTISGRLLSASGGEVLASFYSTADGLKGVLPAVDEISNELRARIGESLPSISAAPSLARVTTPSLDALRRYVQGTRAIGLYGDLTKGLTLLEEAVTLDTGFAMAYRVLGVEYMNTGDSARGRAMLQKAFDHRDRLGELERHLLLGTYYQLGARPDVTKAAAAYEAALSIEAENLLALNNLGNLYIDLRRFADAERLYQTAIATGQASVHHYDNLWRVEFARGKTTEAARTVEQFSRSFPDNPVSDAARIDFAFARGSYDSAQSLAATLLQARPSDLHVRAGALSILANLAKTRGRLTEARRWRLELTALNARRGMEGAAIAGVIDLATMQARAPGRLASAHAAVERALNRHPVGALPPAQRPYERLMWLYAESHRIGAARHLMAGFDQSRVGDTGTEGTYLRHMMLGHLAFAERRYGDAVREYRAADQANYTVSVLPYLGRAHDLAGAADSAIATFTRYVNTPDPMRAYVDGLLLAPAHKRLGELWSLKGDLEKAAEHYLRFVTLWSDADSVLQVQVAQAKQKLARPAIAATR